MIATIDRQEWAYHQRERYLSYAGGLQAGPYTLRERFEFALISAHCTLKSAVTAWQRALVAKTAHDIIVALKPCGSGYRKAALLMELRETPIPPPALPFSEYRRQYKLPGLGPAKLSFALALWKPLESDVVCLDTHMLQLLGVKANSLPAYERAESLVVKEAAQVGLPPFVYQWAVWDWKRGHVESHSFLWAPPAQIRMEV